MAEFYNIKDIYIVMHVSVYFNKACFMNKTYAVYMHDLCSDYMCMQGIEKYLYLGRLLGLPCLVPTTITWDGHVASFHSLFGIKLFEESACHVNSCLLYPLFCFAL